MIQSKLLKVKKWIDLNEAALRLSLALDEPVNAMDLLELGLDQELILSVKLPLDKKFLAKKMTEKLIPVGERLKEFFRFQNIIMGSGCDENDDVYKKDELEYINTKYMRYLEEAQEGNYTEEQRTFDYFCNSVMYQEWDYGPIKYLDENVYELSMLGAEGIDIMALIQENKNREMEELTNLNGVILRSRDGQLFNLQEKFNEEYPQKLNELADSTNEDESSKNESPEKKSSENARRVINRFHIEESHYFPAGGLPAGCEIGISPENLSKFELKLSDEHSIPSNQILITLGAALNTVTSSRAKKWTQGDLASSIAELKISKLGERVINGIFSEANKAFKSNS